MHVHKLGVKNKMDFKMAQTPSPRLITNLKSYQKE